MGSDNGLIKYAVLLVLIIISFIVISKFFIMRDKTGEIDSYTMDISIEETEIKDNAMIASAVNDNLFEVIQTSNVSNKFVSYVIADKKTGLCYLVMQNENSLSITEYKNHLGEQFNIMSFPSYNSPYEENIESIKIGE